MDNRIGAQLYTLRDFCKTTADFEQTIKKVKEIGYKTVQLSGIGDIAPEDIKSICGKYSVEPVCTHRGFGEYTDDIDKVIAYHKTIGCSIAGVGSMPNAYRQSSETLRDFAKKSQKISDELKKEGLTFAYHNHAFEFAKDEDGKYLMDIITNETDIKLILDVYWLSVAGIDPAEFIKKFGSRVPVVHFKDLCILPGTNEQAMAEVMEGNLNWDKIIDACRTSGVGYAMVEQDTCRRDPFESMSISYRNLVTKGFN